MKKLTRFAALLLAGTIAAGPVAQACTGITLTAQNGNVVRARTMEFQIDLKTNVMVSPRGYQRVGITPDGKPGLTWKAKYASVGANPLGLPYVVDGLNEKGLSVGLFYFAQSAGYQPYTDADAARTVAPWQLASYILDNFATIAEVRANLPKIRVPAVVFDHFKIVLPVHFIVTDATGKSIVIEYTEGKLHIYDDPIGVITNNPPFPWQMTNLQNYVNLGLDNVAPKKLGSYTVQGLGQGTGLLGLPGDFTAPSRFVRAAIFSKGVPPGKTATDEVFQAFHILNNFDIPKGVAREGEKDAEGNVIADFTQWTSADDLTNKRFYFRTYDDSDIRYVDLMKQNLNAPTIKIIPMAGHEVAHELGTPRAQ